VIHVTEPAERLTVCLVERHHLKVLHEEAGDDRRQWRIQSHVISLLVETAAKTDIGGGEDIVEEPQDIFLKMLT
jgi:hypothetical protein